MKNTALSSLDLVEQQFNEVSVLLASGDAVALEQASASLQALAVELMQALKASQRKELRAPEVVARIRTLSAGVGTLRDNLARRSALVHQALRIVVPQEAKSTYSAGGQGFGQIYGQPVQQSGAFKVLAA